MRMLVAALAYLLFPVPLLVERRDPLLRFHARQGLGLLVLWIGAWALGRWCDAAGLPQLGWLGYAACLLLACAGIYQALGLRRTPLPYIGGLIDRIPLWRDIPSET